MQSIILLYFFIAIWHRFPKFVLGFIVASILFSFFVSPDGLPPQKSRSPDSGPGGSRSRLPASDQRRISAILPRWKAEDRGAFLLGQGFDIFWTLLPAWLFFGGVMFAAPKI